MGDHLTLEIGIELLRPGQILLRGEHHFRDPRRHGKR